MANRLTEDKIESLFECFRCSLPIRAAARRVGVSQHTAANYLRQFEAQTNSCVLCLCGHLRHRGWCKAQEAAERVEAFCGCGKPLRHRGWCTVRFERSAKRQRFMRRWHPEVHAVTPLPLTFVTMSPAIPREKQALRDMLAQAVANTSRLDVNDAPRE